MVLPGLDVAGGPVVEEGEAEEVGGRVGDGDARAEGVAGADVGGDFELVVELVGGLEDGRGWSGSLSWPWGRRMGVPLMTSEEARPW